MISPSRISETPGRNGRMNEKSATDVGGEWVACADLECEKSSIYIETYVCKCKYSTQRGLGWGLGKSWPMRIWHVTYIYHRTQHSVRLKQAVTSNSSISGLPSKHECGFHHGLGYVQNMWMDGWMDGRAALCMYPCMTYTCLCEMRLGFLGEVLFPFPFMMYDKS